MQLRLPALDDHQALALITVVRHLIHADGRVSMEELIDLVELGAALGKERFSDVMERSEPLHLDRALALELGATIRTPSLRRMLVGLLESIAAGDGLHPEERAFIDDLQHLWRSRALPAEVLQLKNAHGSVAVHPVGATVCSWIPTGDTERLFVSPHSAFAPGKAIRGGIPVCWPWFARDREGPSHGVVRTREWSLVERSEDTLVLALEDDEHTREVWPHAFRVELTVQLGASLTVTLTHHNTDERAVTCWGALHTYLRDPLHVSGLDGAAFFDKLTGSRGVQQGPITQTADRILAATSAQTRRTGVRTSGPNIVVWNPGDGARNIPDLPTAEGFVCVEGAIADDNRVEVEPGQSASLSIELVAIEKIAGSARSPSR